MAVIGASYPSATALGSSSIGVRRLPRICVRHRIFFARPTGVPRAGPSPPIPHRDAFTGATVALGAEGTLTLPANGYLVLTR